MLFNASKSEHITGQFVEPYFIQTDSSGIIMGMNEKSARLLSEFGAFDQRSDSLLTFFTNLSFNNQGFSSDQKIENLPASIDLLLSSPPKKEKWIRWTISVVSFDRDQIKSWQFTGMEIEQQKTLDQETEMHHISKSEKEETLSDSIINSLPGIFYLFDHEGKFLRWNKRFELVSGYSANEIARMHPRDFFSEKDKDYISGRIQKSFVEGVSDAEADLLTKDGNSIPHYFTGQHILFEEQSCL
ncbi:MAG TPA: PAS domain S-box protein, partial [Puia sp.]|nr:PAS domain S-box protein [Puia sp.]